MRYKIYLLSLTTVMLFSSNASGQNYKAYIDSIDQYRQYVDSLIHSSYATPAVTLSHTIAHYNCANGERGGSADLYQDVDSKMIYSFDYVSFCDSLPDERTYYFINNKIALVLMDRKTKAKYYRNNDLVAEDNIVLTQPKADDKDLVRGYEILKDFSFKSH